MRIWYEKYINKIKQIHGFVAIIDFFLLFSTYTLIFICLLIIFYLRSSLIVLIYCSIIGVVLSLGIICFVVTSICSSAGGSVLGIAHFRLGFLTLLDSSFTVVTQAIQSFIAILMIFILFRLVCYVLHCFIASLFLFILTTIHIFALAFLLPLLSYLLISWSPILNSYYSYLTPPISPSPLE